MMMLSCCFPAKGVPLCVSSLLLAVATQSLSSEQRRGDRSGYWGYTKTYDRADNKTVRGRQVQARASKPARCNPRPPYSDVQQRLPLLIITHRKITPSCEQAYEAAMEAGLTFLDTAEVYGEQAACPFRPSSWV